jgi:chemotaxis protein methyltransferase CheR
MLTTQERTSEHLLAQFSELVAGQMGLYFPHERWRDLERGVTAAAQEFGFRDAESCIRDLIASPLSRDQIHVLASHLTVGETYFFREKRSLGILENEILPELIRSRRGGQQLLRLWSAGCCTGEEAYTLACLLSGLLPDPQDWHITILGTDINPRSLRKAMDGIYTRWSFRDNPPSLTERYFEAITDGRFVVRDRIKKMVTFSYLNLVEDSYPSLPTNTTAMDVILCRNVLMYFAPEVARRVVHKLYCSLMDGGWLIVSPTETSQALFSEFATVNFPGAFFYRKGAARPAAARDFAVPHTQAEFPDLSEIKAVFPTKIQPVAAEPQSPTVQPQTPPHSVYDDALSLHEQGRYAEAEEKLTALLGQEPAATNAVALLARVYANQGKLAEALAWCEKAVAIDKLNPGHHYLRATVLQEQCILDEAIKSFKRALYLDDHFVLAHFALGNLARNSGKYREADKHLENALQLLREHGAAEVLPDSDGITAGRLAEVIASMMERKAASS